MAPAVPATVISLSGALAALQALATAVSNAPTETITVTVLRIVPADAAQLLANLNAMVALIAAAIPPPVTASPIAPAEPTTAASVAEALAQEDGDAAEKAWEPTR